MFRTLCLSGPAGCTIKSMVGRAAEHGLNAAWEDTTAARSALKQSLAGAAMSAVAGTTGALQLVLLCLAAGVYWIKGVWVLFTHCYQPLQGDDGCGDTGRSFINVIDIALWSTLCRVAGMIVVHQARCLMRLPLPQPATWQVVQLLQARWRAQAHQHCHHGPRAAPDK
jgi:hypothetical protein